MPKTRGRQCLKKTKHRKNHGPRAPTEGEIITPPLSNESSKSTVLDDSTLSKERFLTLQDIDELAATATQEENSRQPNFWILQPESEQISMCPDPVPMHNHKFLNLCFGASVFQLLFSSHLFVSALVFMVKPLHENVQTQTILDALLDCYDASTDSLTSKNFNLTSRHKKLSTGDQQDAAEFLGYILDELTELAEFKHPVREEPAFQEMGRESKSMDVSPRKFTSIFERLYQGRITSQLPDDMKYTEPFNVLILYMTGGARTLRNLIASTLQTNESKFAAIPPVFFIQLSRAVIDPKRQRIYKHVEPIHFDEKLILYDKWFTSSAQQIWRETVMNDHPYHLKGVVCHYGDFSVGHYTAFVKRGDDWWECDDQFVSPRLLANHRDDLERHACLLLYEQQNVCPVNPLLNNILGTDYPNFFLPKPN